MLVVDDRKEERSSAPPKVRIIFSPLQRTVRKLFSSGHPVLRVLTEGAFVPGRPAAAADLVPGVQSGRIVHFGDRVVVPPGASGQVVPDSVPIVRVYDHRVLP